ncbi:MAG: RNA chaperone Hfq [Alphaproteobacteria bacterium]|nr:RNA chaperone Hfq [Alphaproteobacteria bacterium]
MAAEKQQNIQDVFLNTARKKKVPVTVFLTHGVKLQGVIGSFDNFSMVLKRAGQIQLVYKHAIASIVPSGPLSLHDESEDDGLPAGDY